MRNADMTNVVSEIEQAELDRPAWKAPSIAEYDIANVTAITNCGSGDDGVICASGS